MKLAEALVYRSDLDKSINEIKDRLVQNSLVQQGRKPAEAPEDLFQELDNKMFSYEDLVTRINKSNLEVKTETGLTLTAAIAKRDTLQRLHGVLNNICNHANSTVDRYRNTEILNVATIDVAGLRRRMDQVAKERRELECQIQAANWTNNLV